MSKRKPEPETQDKVFERLATTGSRDGAYARRRTGRKNITLYIKEEIIKKCRPNPATKLRVWIEKNFPLD